MVLCLGLLVEREEGGLSALVELVSVRMRIWWMVIDLLIYWMLFGGWMDVFNVRYINSAEADHRISA
jgi:hypothetical protein